MAFGLSTVLTRMSDANCPKLAEKNGIELPEANEPRGIISGLDLDSG